MASSSFVCATCRHRLQVAARRLPTSHDALKRSYTRPSFAPKPSLDLKHIRQNPGLYEQNCIDRNYPAQARHSWRILQLHEQSVQRQKEALEARRRNNALGREIQSQVGKEKQDEKTSSIDRLVEEARKLKDDLQSFSAWEAGVREEMEALALDIPNLSSNHTPVGDTPEVIGWINGETPPLSLLHGRRSHVDIGRALDLLDFEASATTSGWGWYFLKNEAAWLEQALIQFALHTAAAYGWQITTPPSLVYAHIAHACGFQPRDQNGETQIYHLASPPSASNSTKTDIASSAKPSLVLTGTAEIPFAASYANKTLHPRTLPLKVIGPSRCYRAEAGARGVDTKGLYRVHEFTKVEMFAWTQPPSHSSAPYGGIVEEGDEESFSRFVSSSSFSSSSSSSDVSTTQTSDPTTQLFDEILEIQTHILTSLGLHAKIIEMPSTDLGASAARKVDIEAFFPSRYASSSSISGSPTGGGGKGGGASARGDGYGEVTSASICTDYQTRRLNTRLERGGSAGLQGNKVSGGGGGGGGEAGFPYTLNGTAVAVPRVLACLLETHWDENEGVVRIPECLRKWMPGGIDVIGPKKDRKI